MNVRDLKHLELLGLDASADISEIRRTYRKLVRHFHPDLAAPDERPARERKMMHLNEAYDALLRATRCESPDPMPSAPTPGDTVQQAASVQVDGWDYDLHGKDPELAQSRSIGQLKDPAYAYYKRGFVHFSMAFGGIEDRKGGQLSADEDGLERAVYSLQHFHRAHGYFQRVVTEFPDSIWTRDANFKLKRIEGFNRIYKKIRRNLSDRASEHANQESSGLM